MVHRFKDFVRRVSVEYLRDVPLMPLHSLLLLSNLYRILLYFFKFDVVFWRQFFRGCDSWLLLQKLIWQIGSWDRVVIDPNTDIVVTVVILIYWWFIHFDLVLHIVVNLLILILLHLFNHFIYILRIYKILTLKL